MRGTICGSQVVENPETVRPNPAQTMYEVQPSRLLPFQISTFDCREQAMMNIQACTFRIFAYKGIDFFRFQTLYRSQLGRTRANGSPQRRELSRPTYFCRRNQNLYLCSKKMI